MSFVHFICVMAIGFGLTTASVTVTDENQAEYGVPVGTELQDDSTGRLVPPLPSDNFSVEQRYQITVQNSATKDKYCQVNNADENRRRLDSNDERYCFSNGQSICCGGLDCDCNHEDIRCSCGSR